MQPTVQADADSWPAVASPEFAARFGRLLTTTRRRSKHSIEEFVASGRSSFDASQLRLFEQGSTAIDESIVEALCLVYSADIGSILPARLPVSIADGCVSGAGMSVAFSLGDANSLLVAYLRLIRRMRSQKKAPTIALRRDDVLTLAQHLDIDGADVVERLSTLMNFSASQRSTMAMLFATGAVVIGLAAAGQATAGAGPARAEPSVASAASELGVAQLLADQAPDSEPEVATETAPVAPTVEPTPRGTVPPTAAPVTAPVTVVTAEVVTTPTPTPTPPPIPITTTSPITTSIVEPAPADIAESPSAARATESVAVEEAVSAAVIDEAAEVVGRSTAQRALAPVAAPPLTVAAAGPTQNLSGCNPDPSEAVMSIVIPDIGYTCPVYAGGQSMIDAGFVTLVTDAGANRVLATRPGEPGTLWLAGHRTTHGAAFARVPDLANGALITVGSGGVTATYRVIGRAHVEVRGDRVVDASGNATAEATWASIIRDDFSGNLAPRLVLQTCEGANFRWMVYADLVP